MGAARHALPFFQRSQAPKGGHLAMFNIGFSELLLVLLVAFLVVGPKDLPKVARWLGRAVKKSRRLLNEIKKESGWDEL